MLKARPPKKRAAARRQCPALPPMETAEGRSVSAAIDQLAAAIDRLLENAEAESGNQATPLRGDATGVALHAPLCLALLCLQLQAAATTPPPSVQSRIDELKALLEDSRRLPVHEAVCAVFRIVAAQSDAIRKTLDTLSQQGRGRPH